MTLDQHEASTCLPSPVLGGEVSLVINISVSSLLNICVYLFQKMLNTFVIFCKVSHSNIIVNKDCEHHYGVLSSSLTQYVTFVITVHFINIHIYLHHSFNLLSARRF